jgi:FlaA1/EpsC-like NDP-sugar epimerase
MPSSYTHSQRFVLKGLADASAWALGVAAALVIRFEGRLDAIDVRSGAVLATIAVVAQVVLGRFGGLYPRRWRYGSFDEVLAVGRIAAAVALALVVSKALLSLDIPRSTAPFASVLAVVLMVLPRVGWRLHLRRRLKPQPSAEAVLVVGGGSGGELIVRSMIEDRTSPFVPVAIVDDDPTKRGLRLHGVRVEGDRHRIPELAQRFSARRLVIAIPSASSALIRELCDLAHVNRLDVLVLPALGDLFNAPTIADLRPVTEDDLLGRRVIDTDVPQIASYVTGKRVLVTGAGGSIGSELVRQLHRFAPAQLVMLDRDESALHGVQLSISGRALLEGDDTVLVDLRDRDGLHAVFERYRPEVVFHAAALKHLPMLERFPDEARKTNVIGTQQVLDAAMAVGVQRFVNISTDKAADPVSVLGRSKRLTERLTAAAAQASGRPYVSVRFGNVLGSRGSVLIAFRSQIEQGGPVTVTHPEVTRYFMTVQEAVQLVIQAGAIGQAGEVLVLDMGEPVRIADVAQRMVAAAGKPIRIEYTGLREGEKLHEDLLGSDEIDVRPVHPLISHATVPPLSLDDALDLCDAGYLTGTDGPPGVQVTTGTPDASPV